VELARACHDMGRTDLSVIRNVPAARSVATAEVHNIGHARGVLCHVLIRNERVMLALVELVAQE